MAERKPQINFQVEEPLKHLYDEAHEQGHRVTRLCAAGLLLMIENPRLRSKAITRLREWEAEYEKASAKQIRVFVEGAQTALQGSPPGSRPTRPTRTKRKKAKRA